VLCVLVAIAIGFGVLSSGVARAAQPWLEDRRFREGAGIRIKNVELHPGIGAEVGADSNYYQGSGQQNSLLGVDGEAERTALRLRISPSFSLSTVGEQRKTGDGGAPTPPVVQFRASTAFLYNELFFLGASRLAGGAVDQRTFQADVGFKLDILPGRPWGGDIAVSYQRVAEPSNDYSVVSAFDRNTVAAAFGLAWRPSAGILDWRLGYRVAGTFFERTGFGSLDGADHTVLLDGSWRFLPRTSLLYRGTIGARTYAAPTAEVPGGAAVGSQLGLRGLVTRQFGVLALGGWKSTFYNEVPPPTPVVTSNYDGPTAHIEVSWYPSTAQPINKGGAATGLSSIAVGYDRDALNSYLANYYQQDRFFLRAEHFIGGYLLLQAEGGFARLARPPSYFSSGARRNYYNGLMTNPLVGDLIENRLDALAFAEYRVMSSLGINLTALATAGLKDAVVQLLESDAPGRTRDNLRFTRFEIYLGVRWFL
jgi:hypothetical protein